MNEYKKSNTEIFSLIKKKMYFFEDVIQQTILHSQKSKTLNILTISDLNNSIYVFNDLNKKIKELNEILQETNNTDELVNKLQTINNELSTLFKSLGTYYLENLLTICLGNNSINLSTISDIEKEKYDLLKKYFHPTSYKLLNLKKKENEEPETYIDKLKNLDCIDVHIKTKNFYLNVYGLQLVVHNPQHNKSIIINGYIDDINIDFISNKFIELKTRAIRENIPNSNEFQNETFNRYIQSLNLKDYLINEPHEIYLKYMGYLNNLNTLKQKTLSQNVKDFVSSDTFTKRNIIIQLLIQTEKYDNQYLAYLLYDLLTNNNSSETNNSIDSLEQTNIYDTFPWIIKNYFKDAMKNTIQYTNDLANFEIQKIPLEQQICLLKANDNVKEKAMQKLKEIKAKTEDSGAKARQYLDGLLRIPFNIYKREPILNTMNNIKILFNNLIKKSHNTNIINKNNYTSLEILKYIQQIKNNQTCIIDIDLIKKNLLMLDKPTLVENIIKINNIIVTNSLSIKKLKYSNKKKNELLKQIDEFINFVSNINITLLKDLFICIKKVDDNNNNISYDIEKIENEYNKIKNYMSDVRNVLDKAVYGHLNAKKQIERIISQWITGDNNMGHIFGFEGNPGIGKTSLAKGLANCLVDENGVSRPFALIAIGGDANSSTLIGHNYTYVGSTWGSIVQILMDKKCLNPIILIDEVDKISRTEHGKEIIGVLTHLLDTTQNDTFQDKYFSGIDLDLSKAIFILSYNDVELIDRILLDRIHRVRFDSLTIEDKIVICNRHLLPEIYMKFGLENMIKFTDDIIKFIIEEYTLEPGVRKLKEKLHEIIGEINVNILKNNIENYDIPINITIEDIKHNYLKHIRENSIQKIHSKSVNNMINGMWANSYNCGGILTFQACFSPANSFLEIILTGNQKDVMKEGMILSRNIAWNITSHDKQLELIKKYNDVKNNCVYGINIHAGDLSTPKDGPSASSTIVILLYALFNDIKIKNYFAMTGEICFDGKIKEIGGLETKIIGSIKNGVTEIIFPSENNHDFNKFMEKYKNNKIIDNIKFHPVSNIYEIFDLIYEKE
jgi:ATP-dependent Lon protease